TWDGNRDGNWICADWKTGKVKFEESWKCKGSMVFADGMLYCYEEKTGNVALVKASPSGFKVISSFKMTAGDGQHWAHPVVSDGVLYVRHGNALRAYDVKGN
ncbi:MAG: alcohol dehydrogenase, partial [Phycisphaerae bacterium]|nr:alcohol dehydrogenase [Phycisphaerae bacterium]